MVLWLKKHCDPALGDALVSFDEPEEDQKDEWQLLTTRDFHYAAIAVELERQARMYHKAEDYRSAKVATDLAATLRTKKFSNPEIN